MGNLVSIRLRIIAAAWMGSVAEPGDLGAAGGAPALDEHEAVAHAQRVAALERRHAAVGSEGVAQRQLPYVLGHVLPYAGCLDVGRAAPAAELGFGLLLFLNSTVSFSLPRFIRAALPVRCLSRWIIPWSPWANLWKRVCLPLPRFHAP